MERGFAPSPASFLPPDYVQAKAQRRTNLVCLSLFALVLLTVVLALLVTDRQRQDVRQLQLQTDQAYAQAAARLDQLDTLEQRKKQLIRKAQITCQLLEKVPRSRILGELTNALPDGAGLLEFSLETKTIRIDRPTSAATAIDQAKQTAQAKKNGAGEPEPIIQEVSLQLVGTAATDVQVAQYLASLSSHPLFQDVTLVSSEQKTIDDRPIRKFRIDLKVASAMPSSTWRRSEP